jgi:AcrR family transcriptional regulator
MLKMKNIVREPQQERSIEKKNRIIEAGYQLFSEVGYYGTNTAEIAKRAGVSTGIVYGYFSDKRDILICVLEIYINKVFDPVLKMFDNLKAPVDYNKLIPDIIDLIIKTHKKHAKMHEVLHSLAGNDEAVNAQFIALEDSITLRISDKFSSLGIHIENAMEKIHFIMDIIQTFSHEYVFDKHEYIDYFVMRNMVTQTIINLLTNDNYEM